MRLIRWWLQAIALAGVISPFGPAIADAEEPLLPLPKPAPVVRKATPVVPKFANLAYGDAPGGANLLDIYLPEKKEGPFPLVVWIHGGGWANGDKSPSGQFLQLLPRGFAVASINYRLSGQAHFPAQIYDCKGAIRWLRAHAREYQLDPDRIGVWGLSAGGHLVALLGTSGGVKELEGDVGGNLGVSSRVQAVSDYCGPTDLLQFYDQAGPDNVFKNNLRLKGDTYFEALFGGGPLEQHNQLIRLANPINYISSNLPPFQIFHGSKDTLVPVGQSQILADALKNAGSECDFTIIDGYGHGFGQRQYLATFAFFEKRLKGAP
ncbi:MAG: alpha/beta hydrolase [bacterium]